MISRWVARPWVQESLTTNPELGLRLTEASCDLCEPNCLAGGRKSPRSVIQVTSSASAWPCVQLGLPRAGPGNTSFAAAPPGCPDTQRVDPETGQDLWDPEAWPGCEGVRPLSSRSLGTRSHAEPRLNPVMTVALQKPDAAREPPASPDGTEVGELRVFFLTRVLMASFIFVVSVS